MAALGWVASGALAVVVVLLSIEVRTRRGEVARLQAELDAL